MELQKERSKKKTQKKGKHFLGTFVVLPNSVHYSFSSTRFFVAQIK